MYGPTEEGRKRKIGRLCRPFQNLSGDSRVQEADIVKNILDLVKIFPRDRDMQIRGMLPFTCNREAKERLSFLRLPILRLGLRLPVHK